MTIIRICAKIAAKTPGTCNETASKKPVLSKGFDESFGEVPAGRLTPTSETTHSPLDVEYADSSAIVGPPHDVRRALVQDREES